MTQESFSILASDRGPATPVALADLRVQLPFFQYPSLGSWPCNNSGGMALGVRVYIFQYPSLGSWPCNSGCRQTEGRGKGCFQYPSLGSWPCNVRPFERQVSTPMSFSILASDRGPATPVRAACAPPGCSLSVS